MTRGSWHRRRSLTTNIRVVATTAALVMLAATAAIADPGVTPSTVDLTLAPGASDVVAKAVETAAISPKPDIVFLADTTGSMGGALANVQSSIANIITSVRNQQPDAQFGAAQYKDEGDVFVYNLDSAITANDAAVTAAVNSWTPSGGGDTPEGQIDALYHLGTDANVGWRPGASHIIVQFGDAPGHDPSNGHTLNDVITALTGTLDARYLGIDVGALDSTGQATALANATGGLVLPASGDVSGAILAGLQSIDATVTPTTNPDTCEPGLSITWNPLSLTVHSGAIAHFQETIAVLETAEAGTTLTCPVTFAINGASDPGPAFVESTTVHVAGNVPGAPTLNQALAGNHEVGLNWSPPDSEGGSPITKYTVYVNPCPSGGEGGCVVLDNVSPNPNSGSTFNYVIGGLTNGTTYSFTVTASNDSGEGPPSNPLSATPNGSADTDTIRANGRGTVDTGFAGGANSSDPSCSSDPSSVSCKNIVARYSLVDRKNVGAVIGLASVSDDQTPGGPIACLEFDFATNQVAAPPDCETVADKALLSTYPTNVATLVRPHFASEQNDTSVTTLELGAPCFQLVTNANGTPKLATNGDPICKNPNFPSVFGSGPIKTNMCPDGTGWTATKPCAYVYYKVERIDGYDLSPADCGITWPNCTWGTLASPKARRPVQCSSGPTCGKEVIIGSSISAGIKLASGQYAVRPWCQGPQSEDDAVAPFIKWLPCDLFVAWLNNVRSTSVHYNDVLWTDLEVNDPGENGPASPEPGLDGWARSRSRRRRVRSASASRSRPIRPYGRDPR